MRWAVGFRSPAAVFKNEAIAARYPGGIEAFEANFKVSGRNAALRSVSFGMLLELEEAAIEMKDAGILLGVDYATAEESGPTDQCPGIRFFSEENSGYTKWWAMTEGQYEDAIEPEFVKLASQGVPVQPQYSHAWPRPPGGQKITNFEWRTVLERAAAGMMDSWTEYLCVRALEGQWELSVCGYEVIAEVPQEWYDEDGEPTEEHRDSDGFLVVPDVFDGREVTGIEGNYLTGPMMTLKEPVSLSDHSLGDVEHALGLLDWPPTDAGRALIKICSMGRPP